MTIKVTNNAYSTLAGSITDVATTLAVQAGHGARFPSLSAGEYFYATLIDSSNNLEIIKVTARSTDSFTMTRGAEGTTNRAYTSGDRIELRITAGTITDFAAGTLSPAVASAGTVTLQAGALTHITGTTTITDVDFTPANDGAWAMVIFDGALTLTHHATTLKLPGGANITTAAGDRAIFVQDSTDNAICVIYEPAAGSVVAAASTTVSGKSEFATAAEYRTGTDTARSLVVDQVWASAAEVTLTDAATIAVDMSTFLNAVVTLGGNRTLGQPSNTKVGQTGVIRIVQPGSGGPYTLAYHADWEFVVGTAPVLSTAASTNDLLFYQVLAANRIFASLVKGVA
jgi:hypothetical protein